MEDKKYAVCCTVCQRLLGKSGEGSKTSITCPRCGSDLYYEIIAGEVKTRVVRWSSKQKKSA